LIPPKAIKLLSETELGLYLAGVKQINGKILKIYFLNNLKT
jgi:hypothetical protein